MAKLSIKTRARGLFGPVVEGLLAAGVSPTLVSVLGLAFGLYGALVLARGSLFWGGVWLLVSGLCDVLDGSLARKTHGETLFGAFIDSTLDRISELAYFCALLVYYTSRFEGYSNAVIVLICVALSGAMLTSYARARLEGIGRPCEVGLLERPERLVILAAGLLLGRRVLPVALGLLAVGSTITVLQRIVHAWRVARTD